ncbi:hypothetical protein JJJ17_19330 [Paracoccus caeni]|uniref:Uncharacterized protein n=1 Tax=Paracoccus caeni TaxID=657651 RepID=A0A934VWI3_9RHOB|nr:hypothetical protein [Paracoccus caeni]MBK4218086.1 hypothetical protein [Paracoccus caeni]
MRAFDYLADNWGTLGKQADTALSEGKNYVYIDVDIVDIFGTKANARFSGYARVGSATNPTGVTSVDFTGGKIRTGLKIMEDPITKKIEAVYDSSFPMAR